MPQWTDEQKQAIYTKGHDTLVAAAAGSGKTAVLVERIIQKVIDLDDPVNIDELLVATFTNAAAQEMRNRVQQALESALEENPTSTHLKKQTTLLQQASISTLHAFCLDLVKRHSYLIDIDPGFRIADNVEADLLRQEVIDDLFETWYSDSHPQQSDFFNVVERFSNDRNDKDVETLILKLYDFAMQNPWPETWLSHVAETYHVEEDQLLTYPWFNVLSQSIDDALLEAENYLEKALQLTKNVDGPYHYAEAVEFDLEQLQQLKGQKAIGWSELYRGMETLSFKSLSRKSVDCDPALKAKTKDYRNQAKDRLTDLKQQLFTRSLEDYLADMAELYPTIQQLVTLVKVFRENYQAVKRDKGLVDFSDLEHFALAVLTQKTSEGFEKTEIAKQLETKYKEVLVDEYQDTNMVQETILQAITKDDPGNLFMVGDVKQSIYRFRHAEPSLFLTKYKMFYDQHHSGERIDLAKNFRSRKELLAGANFIFRQLFDENVGEMNYDAESELIYGNLNYDEAKKNDPEVELVIVDRNDNEVDDDAGETTADLRKAELEARIYAEKINSWIGRGAMEPAVIFDKDTLERRPCRYRDIVILLRSMTSAPVVMEELKKQGIPVYAELQTGYLQAIEIQVMVNVLKIIDNTKQDIPLASVLKSPIVGLNEEELTQIRLMDKKASFHDCFKLYLEAGGNDKLKERLNRFKNQLSDWKNRNQIGALSDLIWYIYRDSGYYDFVSGMPGGRQRQANLRALYDRARGYEETSFRGLYRFLRMIERMEERGEDLGAARALGEQEDVVRITTIHKSKGLEYPIVILGAMDKNFNQQDLKAKYLLHKDLGFASKYIDPEKRIMYPTLIYQAIKHHMKRELWAEEMRVLYVALTRAKEKLVMIGTVANFEKKQAAYQEVIDAQDWVLPADIRLKSSSYLDWVAYSLVRHPAGQVLRVKADETDTHGAVFTGDDALFKVEQHGVHRYHTEDVEKAKTVVDLEAVINHEAPLPKTDEADNQFVKHRLNYQYPHQAATIHRAKQSVTEIKRRLTEPDPYAADELLREVKPLKKERPRFMQGTKKLTAAEKGTAMHTVMQHLPFDKPLTEATLNHFIDQLIEKELLTYEQGEAIDRAKILAFLASPVIDALNKAEIVEREVPFSLMLNTEDVYQNWEGASEQVFLQGVIDLLVKTNQGWTIVDYKTDTITGAFTAAKRKQLVERYRVQLDLYTKAIETILAITIHKRFLYFFDVNQLVEVE